MNLILAVAALSSGITIMYILRLFTNRKDILVATTYPIIILTIGYVLRNSQLESNIVIGYYLTDLAFLVTFLLSSLALLLGQIKYWKEV